MRFDPQANRVGGLDETPREGDLPDFAEAAPPGRRRPGLRLAVIVLLAGAGAACFAWSELGDRRADENRADDPSSLAVSPKEVLGSFSLSRTSSAPEDSGRRIRIEGGSPSASSTQSSDDASDAAASGSSEARTALAAGRRALNMRRYREAIPHLERAVRLDPSIADARYNLGLAYTQTGRSDLARAQREALRPLDRNLANLLGALLRE